MTQKATKRYIRRSLKKQRGGAADCTKCVVVVNMTKKLLEVMHEEISKQEDSDFKTSMMAYNTTIMSILLKHEEEQRLASMAQEIPVPVLGAEYNNLAANTNNNTTLNANVNSTTNSNNNNVSAAEVAPTNNANVPVMSMNAECKGKGKKLVAN